MVRLVDAEAQLDKAVYVIANQVKANLVTSAHQWPGLISLPSAVGNERVFKRPKGFFRENGPLPAQATLRTEPLPAHADRELDAYIALLTHAVADKESELADKRGFETEGRGRVYFRFLNLSGPAWGFGRASGLSLSTSLARCLR